MATAAVTMAAVNRVQPSQLAEEQRNATTAIAPSRVRPNDNRVRERPGSAQRRVEEAGRTSLLEPSSPPRSTGRSRRLARRRLLRLEARMGCFLLKLHGRERVKVPVVRALKVAD